MLLKTVLLKLFLLSFSICYAQNNSSSINLPPLPREMTYENVIAFYTELAKKHPFFQLEEFGKTDSGKPLHLITYAKENSSAEKAEQATKVSLLINNGIHPGEPDGIEATMRLFQNLANKTISAPKNLTIHAIPVYNIGGALNRNSTTRTNQNGPEEYGFRGNARNYDLNRDFIKADSKNARSFFSIFHRLNPDVYVDTHVSNGADYQYTITHLFSQHNKAGGKLGEYIRETFQPAIEQKLLENNWEATPYVNIFNKPPEEGFKQFMDYPRYSTGYTTLFQTLGVLIETHMLKPYEKRTDATYDMLLAVMDFAEKNHTSIRKIRQSDQNLYKAGNKYPLQWKTDSSSHTTLSFKGFESKYIKSNVTGKKRLFYDRKKPTTFSLPFYDTYQPQVFTTIPKSYIIPQGWWPVIDLLKQNHITLQKTTKDTVFEVEVYTIKDYKTVDSPYEGHYLHYNTKVSKTIEQVAFREGDYLIHTNQPGVRYLLETLEPEAVDSYFNWNFFDSILQQKEGFSPYVFEDIAEELLKNNPGIKREFENKKAANKAFSENWYAQLDWLHKQSEHYEKAHLRYPVYRVLE